eukprot:scpid66892/ scgid27479/ 
MATCGSSVSVHQVGTGCVIERADGNTRLALHKALQQAARTKLPPSTADLTDTGRLKRILYSQADQWAGRSDYSNYCQINMDDIVRSIHPDLWKIVWELTCPRRRLGSLHQDMLRSQCGEGASQEKRRMSVFFVTWWSQISWTATVPARCY